MLPMGLGYVEGVTHDYVRHGNHVRALDVATGEVLSQCRATGIRSFWNIEKRPQDAGRASGGGQLRHPQTRQGEPGWRGPRYHIHYTPTYASWLNQVERWFGIITQQAIRRGTFSSVKQLTRKIDRFVNDYNSTTSGPPPDSILAKVERLSKVICGTAH